MFAHIFKIFFGVMIIGNTAHASEIVCRYFYRGVQNDGGLFFRNNSCKYGNGGYSTTTWNTLEITQIAQETIFTCTDINSQTLHSGGASKIRARFGPDGWGVQEEFLNGSWQKKLRYSLRNGALLTIAIYINDRPSSTY